MIIVKNVLQYGRWRQDFVSLCGGYILNKRFHHRKLSSRHPTAGAKSKPFRRKVQGGLSNTAERVCISSRSSACGQYHESARRYW